MHFYLNQIAQEGHLVTSPLAGSHISIVRREPVSNWAAWKSALNSRISFEYFPTVETNRKHWWLKVRSPELESLRESFGLRGAPRVPFHLTVAVAAKVESVIRKPAPKEALYEASLLRRASLVLPEVLWESSPEKAKLETLRERYYL